MASARLHLPNVPSIPRVQKRMDRAAGLKTPKLRTKNPFSYLSGSIAASHKRKLARSPKRQNLHG